MTRLTAYPQTEREAQQIYTIAAILVQVGEEFVTEEGITEYRVTLPVELFQKFYGKGVNLYVEESEDGSETLITNIYEPEGVAIAGEARDVEE